MPSPDLESEDAGGDLGPIAAEDVGARPQAGVARPQRRRRGALERDAFVYNQTKVEHRGSRQDAPMARDFYAVLAVAKTATDDQIRQRFRQLARERHPDRFAGEQKQAAELEFQEITQAFNVLSDPERRRLHDLDLSKRHEPASDPKQLARVYLQRGVRAYREKNWVEAADNFDRATKADPGSAQGWYNLALTCAQNPTWMARAVAAIERACELESMNPG